MKNPTTEPTSRREKFKLEVAKQGDGFAVQDENDVVYGPTVKTRKEAEELLKDWKAYYE
jgi:hypothetical protein